MPILERRVEMVIITEARRTRVITPTNFRWYDSCINPYVGCEHGCAYCYVRFLVKDKNYPWGDFVRTRDYIKDKLPKEIQTVVGKRICLGTATDPYQPIEKTKRLTRFVLEHLKGSGVIKVGVYTKSDLIMEDLELFKSLPNPNLHMTLTPIPEEIRSQIERVAPPNEARLKVVEAFKKAGVKIRLSVAPMIPGLTDGLIHSLTEAIVKSGADQFYVDPMQPYKQSMAAMDAIENIPNWDLIKDVMTNKISYADWKARMREKWMDEWRKNGNKNVIAIWSDHENKISEDMNTGLPVDPKQEI